MKTHRVLPFYMTYPMPMAYEEEDAMMRDLEYLQQLYPTEAKRYQKKVSDILDKMDYEGSMIYDEYPDRFILYQLSREIADMIRKEDENHNNNYSINNSVNNDENYNDIGFGVNNNINGNSNGNNNINGSVNGYYNESNNGSLTPNRDDDCMEQMILIILFYEIYKRRHNTGRGVMRFY